MKDRDLMKVVKGFRKGILGSSAPDGMCFAVSAALGGYLSACGVPCTVTEYELTFGDDTYMHYCLVMKDGRIIDATGSQFNTFLFEENKMPDVYIGDLPSFYVPAIIKKVEAFNKYRPSTTSNF